MKATFFVSVPNKNWEMNSCYVYTTKRAIKKRLNHEHYYDVYDTESHEYINGIKVLTIKEFDKWLVNMLCDRYGLPKSAIAIGFECKLITPFALLVYNRRAAKAQLCFPKWKMDNAGVDHFVFTIGKNKYQALSRKTRKYPFLEYDIVPY